MTENEKDHATIERLKRAESEGCKGCVYWTLRFRDGEGLFPLESLNRRDAVHSWKPGILGECRQSLNRSGGENFHRTFENDWCGQWSPKELPAEDGQ